MISFEEFNRKFEIIRNDAKGDCLFESVAYLINNLPKDEDEDEEPRVLSHKDIRNFVYKFYEGFDRDIKYPTETIENYIIMGLLYDNDDEDEYGEYISHDKNVSRGKVWGSMTDLLVCSVIFDIDINLYKITESGYGIKLDKMKYQYKNKHTINILYNGVNHFEAIETNVFY